MTTPQAIDTAVRLTMQTHDDHPLTVFGAAHAAAANAAVLLDPLHPNHWHVLSRVAALPDTTTPEESTR